MSSEKHHIICGTEFELENVGKAAIIVRALYGGKTAGAEYWRHVRPTMVNMNFITCKADPDVWMRPGKRDDATLYWQYLLLYTDDTIAIMEDLEEFIRKYVLLYTDDILVIMEEPEEIIRKELASYFTIKDKSIGPPTQYLENKVSQVTIENGAKYWSFSSSQ